MTTNQFQVGKTSPRSDYDCIHSFTIPAGRPAAMLTVKLTSRACRQVRPISNRRQNEHDGNAWVVTGDSIQPEAFWTETEARKWCRSQRLTIID